MRLKIHAWNQEEVELDLGRVTVVYGEPLKRIEDSLILWEESHKRRFRDLPERFAVELGTDMLLEVEKEGSGWKVIDYSNCAVEVYKKVEENLQVRKEEMEKGCSPFKLFPHAACLENLEGRPYIRCAVSDVVRGELRVIMRPEAFLMPDQYMEFADAVAREAFLGGMFLITTKRFEFAELLRERLPDVVPLKIMSA